MSRLSARRKVKSVYRVKNWQAYNAGLIARGSLTVWIDEAVFSGFATKRRGRGRPCLYTDQVIQMLLTLKQVYRLPLRALMGLAQSLKALVWSDLPLPHYSTLSRRAKTLEVVLPQVRRDEPLHLVIDSTGLKVFGEGEWQVRQHGKTKRRAWRKVHLGLDVSSRQVCAVLMTHQDVHDASAMPDLLKQIPDEQAIAIVGGDGAYDTAASYQIIDARGAQPLIPPRQGAVSWPTSAPGAQARNTAIEAIAHQSRKEWKQSSGYHQRSLAENLMYRYKTLTGDKLWARKPRTQNTEIALRVGVINQMMRIARPQSVKIA